MGAFNFSIAGVQAQSTGSKRLKPWDIYKVKFGGCRVDHIQGKKDPSATYDILKIRFDGEDGYFEESIFFPKDGDEKRPVYTNKEGHEYEQPSSWEMTKQKIAQVAAVVNPEGWVKMQELSSKFRSFEDMCNALIKITDPKKDKELYLKLIGKTDKDGNVSAALPKAAGLNKEGQLFPINFISDKESGLFFSDYEEGKRKEYQNAKPTKVAKKESAPETASVEEDNLDDLLGVL